MKRWTKYIMLGLFYIVTVVMAFYIGLSQGFGRGYTYRDIHASPSGAVGKVVVLERLRSGKVDSAIDLLESQLDSEIISHRMGLDNGPAFPHIKSYGEFSEAAKKLMVKVSKYRVEHPTRANDPLVKAEIDYVVRHYSEGSGKSSN